jgi:hypothetical protein
VVWDGTPRTPARLGILCLLSGGPHPDVASTHYLVERKDEQVATAACVSLKPRLARTLSYLALTRVSNPILCVRCRKVMQ